MSEGRRPEVPPNIHRLFEQGSGYLGGSGTRLALLVVVGAVLFFWLEQGIFKVRPEEQAAITTFGRFTHIATPGLNFRWPWPIQRHYLVNVQGVRQIPIGFRRNEAGEETDVPDESLMLTADENIVDVHLSIQYKISNLQEYLFQCASADEVLESSGEVALRTVVGAFNIAETMGNQRGYVQSKIKDELDELLSKYKTGIEVLEVRLLKVDPPEQVKDSFHEVVRAMEDQVRLTQEAETYRNQVIPKAEGEAAEIVEKAVAQKEQRIERATGDAKRFKSQFDAYEKARGVTRERLYLESIERALEPAEKIVLPAGLGQQLLPWLPLRHEATPAATQPEGGR